MRTITVSTLATLAVFMLAGCTYQTSLSEDEALIVNRLSGKVYRAYESVVVELPRIPVESQNSGRILSRTSDISADRFAVDARVKLMNTFLVWRMTIEPARGSRRESDTNVDRLFAELDDLRRLGWTSVTLDLRNADGFLIAAIEVPLNDSDVTRMINDNDEIYGFRYEGNRTLGYEALQEIELVNLRWRL